MDDIAVRSYIAKALAYLSLAIGCRIRYLYAQTVVVDCSSELDCKTSIVANDGAARLADRLCAETESSILSHLSCTIANLATNCGCRIICL